MADGDIVEPTKLDDLALHAIDAGHDRDAGLGETRRVRAICLSSTGTNTTASGTAASASADQDLLLADVVRASPARSAGCVRRASAATRSAASRAGGMSRIDAVLGEDGEGEGVRHGPYFRPPLAL